LEILRKGGFNTGDFFLEEFFCLRELRGNSGIFLSEEAYLRV